MIDCAASNIASDKTIQALGGILERCEKELNAVYEPYISASAMAIQELTLKDLQPSQFYISEKKLHDMQYFTASGNCLKKAIHLPVEKADARFRNEHISLNDIISSNE